MKIVRIVMAGDGWVIVKTAARNAMVPGRLRMTTRGQRRFGNQTVTTKLPLGPPTTLGNMREQGVTHLVAFCYHNAYERRTS